MNRALTAFGLASCLLLAACHMESRPVSRGGDPAAVRAEMLARLDGVTHPLNRAKMEEVLLFRAIHTNDAEMVRQLLSRPGFLAAHPYRPAALGKAAMLANRLGHAEIAALLGSGGPGLAQPGRQNPAAFPAKGAPPGNLDDDAYNRMRASAGMAPEPKPASSDVDQPAYGGRERPDDLALVIGIGKYSKLPEASFAERDADAVAKHLLALGLPQRNIIHLAGQAATRGSLQGYLEEWLPKNVKAGSSVFVYYSGHGAPDPKTGQAYLVPWDGDAMFLQSTAYPLKQLYASLGRLKARQVVVALDACFSGAGGRSVLAKGARPLVTKTEELAPTGSVTVLAAASGDEITGSLDEQGHGMFTYFLLKGLNSGKRSGRELLDFLKPRVQDEARRQNREQTPALLGEGFSL